MKSDRLKVFASYGPKKCSIIHDMVFALCIGCPALRNAVLLEPSLQALPAVFGILLAVAGAVVGIEAVRGVGIQNDLGGLVGVLEGLTHFFHAVDGNAHVGGAVEAEDRGLQVTDQVNRVLGVQFVGLADE